jgi:hypothetical protein
VSTPPDDTTGGPRDLADSYDDELNEARKTLATLMDDADRLQAAVTRGLALCDEYATHHPDWRPLATQTAIVFRRALTGEGDQRWLAGLEAAAPEAPESLGGTP